MGGEDPAILLSTHALKQLDLSIAAA